MTLVAPKHEPLAEGRFFTPSGRARFAAIEPRSPFEIPTSRFPFVLMTGRLRDQWHTMTRSGKSPRLSQTRVEPSVEIHPDDADGLGLNRGGLARITSARGTMLARVETSGALRRGEVFAPMHWNAQFAREGRVGSLIAAAVDPDSGQPELKATAVALERVEPAWQGFVLCRDRLEVGDAFYATCSRGDGYWRHEIAGATLPPSWADWSRDVLGADGEWVEFVDPAAGRYRAARLHSGRLAACVFVTRNGTLPDRGWLGSLFANDGLSDAARVSLLAARPADASAATGPLICACFGVGRDTLIAAIRSQSLTTAAEIGRALRAGTNCGSCIPELNGLIVAAGRDPDESAAERAVG